MIITKEMIDKAECFWACDEALAWLRETPRTVDELVRERPAFAAWALRIPGFEELLSDEQFGASVEASPAYAVSFAWRRLTDAQLAACVLRAPLTAAAYARRRLTPEQLKYCEDRA